MSAHAITLALALLVQPAALGAQWKQANDLGPVCRNTTNSVNRQPDKAVFLRPLLSSMGGMLVPVRVKTHLFVRYEHPAHPVAFRSAKGGYLSQTGA